MNIKTGEINHSEHEVSIWNIGVKFGAVIRMSGAPNRENQANEQFCRFLRCVLRVLITSSTIINEHGMYAAPKTSNDSFGKSFTSNRNTIFYRCSQLSGFVKVEVLKNADPTQ
jgi:hypothetical protein